MAKKKQNNQVLIIIVAVIAVFFLFKGDIPTPGSQAVSGFTDVVRGVMVGPTLVTSGTPTVYNNAPFL